MSRILAHLTETQGGLHRLNNNIKIRQLPHLNAKSYIMYMWTVCLHKIYPVWIHEHTINHCKHFFRVHWELQCQVQQFGFPTPSSHSSQSPTEVRLQMGYPTPDLLNFIQTKRQRFCVSQHLPVNPAIYQQVINIKPDSFNMQESIEIFYNYYHRFPEEIHNQQFWQHICRIGIWPDLWVIWKNIFKPDFAAEGILERAINKAHYYCSSVIRWDTCIMHSILMFVWI